jgi:hypothetical protein
MARTFSLFCFPSISGEACFVLLPKLFQGLRGTPGIGGVAFSFFLVVW